MNASRKVVVDLLRDHLARAKEISQRDHSRPSPAGSLADSYAFDFGSLESCVEYIAGCVDALFPKKATRRARAGASA